jgi:hypothetical protein
VFSIVPLLRSILEIGDERHDCPSELDSEESLLLDATTQSFEQSVARGLLFVTEHGSGFDAVW